MIGRSMVLALSLLVSMAAVPAHWASRWYNPKPATGDLILPLPCGGAMAFRPIAVPAGSGPLGDRPIILGSARAALGYNQYQRRTFLAAPFKDPAGSRAFFLGKYPVTRDQYASVMGKCPMTPSPRGRLPVTDVSWYAAVRFSERLSVWLLAHARDRLPKNAGSYGFIRLPTEAEWEYAARGGVAVTETEYEAKLWPMPSGSEHYLPQHSDGPTQIGFGLPNPLGLYDLLGNVWQWTSTPYHLNRVGRAQGQPGGMVARGGGYATAREALSTALREEVPPFDPATDRPTRLPFVGFRVAIGAVAGGDLAHVEQLKAAFAALMREPVKPDQQAPGSIARSLANQTSDTALRVQLNRLAAQLASERRAETDAADATLHAQLEAASALAYTIWRVQRIITVQQAMLTDPRYKLARDTKEFADLREAVAGNRSDQYSALDAYAALLQSLAFSSAYADVGKELELLHQEFAADADRRQRFLGVIEAEVSALRNGHAIESDLMLHEITAVPRG